MPRGRWYIEPDNEGIFSEDIVERWVITGQLTLETPAHFGNGEVSVLTDMPLIRDAHDGRALLTGASIAGALRNYLREYELGYEQAETRYARAAQLFGRVDPPPKERDSSRSRTPKRSIASLLIIDDALGDTPQPDTELRDGVGIDPKTRTALAGRLYNLELLAPGTSFTLRFELNIPRGEDGGRFKKHEDAATLIESLVVALRGLQEGRIRLGKRKRRGFGQCRVTNWSVRRYNMADPQDLIAWLDRPLEPAADPDYEGDIWSLINQHRPDEQKESEIALADQRTRFDLQAHFALEGSSILIRSDAAWPGAPDMVHLTSNGKPVLSGTSLAGALRARALRIVKTLGLTDKEAKEFIADIFGSDPDSHSTELSASRLLVRETEIKRGLSKVQSRVKLDRFTSGAYPGALFSQQPVFGTPETQVEISLTLFAPKEEEIGLLLMLLKDLWTGDLPLGGEASVGRGRLTGRHVTLTHRQVADSGEISQPWHLSQDEGVSLLMEPSNIHEKLEDFAKTFKRAVRKRIEEKTDA